jgi:cyclopropane-fatty-acyl-phospholipid synthase
LGGCGWGSFAIHCGATRGAELVGITRSEPHARFAQHRAARAGVADRVEIRAMGYCQLTGERFDAVASIGMVEHVGSVEIDRYGQRLRGLLEPGARQLNHGIARLRHGDPDAGPFSERYVFPDATPLHLSRVLSALARAGFATEHVYGFTADYPETLTHWLTRLEDHLEEVVRLAGEQRVRVWGIYLRGAQRVPDGFHVGLPSPRAVVLKDWRLLPLGAAGRTAVLKLFAHSSLRSGARGATARPADPVGLSTGVRDPRAVRPRARGEHEHEPRVDARAHRRGARWLERR